VVQTWIGAVIHIHLLDEPVKPPKIRRILEQESGVGIASLFLVYDGLLPPSGQPIENDKWFVPLPALVNERLYTYRLAGDVPALRTAQFEPVNKHEVETVYGDDVLITQLRHARQSVKQPALKGYWLLADFEVDATARQSFFNRTDDYSRYQPPPPPANGNAYTYGYNSYASGNYTPPSEPPMPTKTKLEASYEALGLPRDANRDEVRAAFRKLAFEVHPDVSELPKDEAEVRFKLLNEAYEYIKVANEWT
jgi:hypothetical protein